jgi:SnoaL-like domain
VTAVDQLRRLLALHNQRLSERDRASLEDLWLEDGTLSLTERGVVVKGREAVVRHMDELTEPGLPCRYFGVNTIPEIEGNRARAWSDFFVLTKSQRGGWISSLGRYLDEFEHTSSGWKFVHRTVVTGQYEPDTTDRLSALQGGEEDMIRLTLAQYNHFLKDRRLNDLVDLWTEDGAFIALGNRYEGREVIREFLASNAMPKGPNIAGGQHLVANVLIEIDGDAAECSSDMFTIVHTPDGPALRGSVGRYVDQLCRDGGRWRFVERRNTTSQWP